MPEKPHPFRPPVAAAPVGNFVSVAFFRGQKRNIFNGMKKNLGNEPNLPGS